MKWYVWLIVILALVIVIASAIVHFNIQRKIFYSEDIPTWMKWLILLGR